jgi:hypothetical protein
MLMNRGRKTQDQLAVAKSLLCEKNYFKAKFFKNIIG